MAQHVESSRWRLTSGASLAWRDWNGEYVVHHFLSNDTHRVTELAGRILLALSASDVLDLCRLAEACGAEGDEVAEVLDSLSQLDLVDKC